MQLVFSHEGKRHYLSLGLPDSKVNRNLARAKANLIESDLVVSQRLFSKKRTGLVRIASSNNSKDFVDEL
ncbi:DUF3596 domain-containing protein [Chroococcidiopsis sp [FACHB-1243]]|uniref:Arm DNA-binding domain-containing protein n=1 Tax=Chroococcidiopsis sp. [FACHB-1243] TaxID=2692781 RepID=UPI0018EF5D68